MNSIEPTKSQRLNNLLCLRSGYIQTHMMLLLLSLIVVLSSTAYGAGGDLLWQAGDSRINSQTAIAGTVDSIGNIIMTGYEQAASEDFYTSKLKADGTGVLWSASLDLAGGIDHGTDVAVDSNGDVIVCGYSFDGTFDFHTIKYNGDTGAIIWENSFNGAANGNDLPTALAIDSLNNVYVGGYSQGGAGDDDFLIIKYSSDGPNIDGTPLWQIRLGGVAGDQDRLTDLVAGLDGIAVVGHSRNSSADFDYLTAKYAFDSTLIWEKTYDGGNAGDDLGKQVAMDSAGNVVITGYSWNGTNNDIRTIKYLGTDGTVDWINTYDGGYADEPRAMVLDNAGDIYLTGATFTASGFNDIYTAKYYGSGVNKGLTTWQSVFNSDSGNTDIGTAIVVDESGAIYAAGYSHKNATVEDDFTTIKYQKNDGTILWQASFNGAAGKDEKVVTIGLGSMAVYVGGWSDQWTGGNIDNDYFAVKYDAGLLDPPTGLLATTVSQNEISLSWQDNSVNEDGFKIERKIGILGQWSEISSIGFNLSTYSDTGLSADTRYYYRVRAYNTTSISYYSNEYTAITSLVNFIAPSWTFFYNGPDGGNDHANAIAVGPDQHPVVTGYSHANLGGFDYLTVKIDRTTASERWRHRYDDVDSELDVATDIVVDNLNDVIVSGYSSLYGGGASNTNDIFTMKYKADGPPQFGSPYLWTDQYNGPAGDDDRSASIDSATDTSNNVVVVGYGRNVAFNEDMYIIKYDSNGNRLWNFGYDGGGDDIPTSVSFDNNDDIIMAGSVFQAPSSWDLFIRKYRGSDGFVEWTVIYDHAGEWDELNGLVVDPAGDVYVAAVVTSAAGDDDFYSAKYNGQTGVKEWEQIYNGPGNGNDEAVAIQRDPNNGDIIVAGTEYSVLGNYDFHVERYSSTGTLIWQKTLDRSGSDDLLTAMGIDVSGNICISGNTDTGGTTDVLAIKYSYDGERIGATQFNGSGNGDDSSVAIAVNTLGEAYVAGETTGVDGSKDFLVMLCEGEVLQAPTPLLGTSSYTSIDLTWTDNSLNEDGFYLQRKVGSCAAPGPWQLLDTALPNTVNFTDSGLNVSSTYCYQIQSFRNNGESSRWIETQVVTKSPAPPGGFAATTVNTTQIDLSWQDNTTTEDGFKIERCQGAGCSVYVEIASIAPDLIYYSDTSVCEGQTYSYRIFAYKTGQWTSLYSNSTSSTSAKSSPSLLAATRISEGQVDLSWNDTNTDHSRFKVYRCEGSGCSGFVEIGTVEDAGGIATLYSDTSVLADTDYRYQVTAQKDAVCNGGWESSPSNTVDIQTTLIAPSGLIANTVNTTQIDLAWIDNTGFETGSVIERCLGSGCDFSVVDTFLVPAAATTYSDTSVCNNSVYSYRVKAEKISIPTWQSGFSATASGSTGQPLSPTLLVATRLSEEQINLTWTTNSTDETGFELDRCEGVSCDFTSKTTLPIPAGTIAFIDKGLLPDTTFRYQLRAYKSAECPWQTPFTAVSEATTTLVLPDNLTATAVNTTQIDLAWQNHTSHETGLVVDRCETGNCTFSEIVSLTSGTNSFSDNNICAGIDYSYRVKAVKVGLAESNGGCWTRKAAVTFDNFQPYSTVRVDLVYDLDMQPDFGDIRFYDETSTEELGYWIENKRDGLSATVWIITSGDPVISMYYGNALAGNVSNPALFNIEFHDDFQGTVIDALKWVELDSVNAIYQDNDLILHNVNNSWTKALISNQIFNRSAGKSMYVRLTPKISPSSGDFMAGWEMDQDLNPSYNQLIYGLSWYYNSAFLRTWEKGGYRNYLNYTTFSINNEHEMKISLKSSGASYFVRQGTDSGWQLVNDSTIYSDTPMRIAFTQLSEEVNIHTVVVAPESVLPVAAGTLGVEQQSACYTFATWQSSYSNIASDTTLTVSMPDQLVATATSESEIDLSWNDNSTDESGFIIERCEGLGCDFSTIVNFMVGPDTTVFNDTGLTMNTPYSYRVQSYKNSLCSWNSAFSNTATDSTLSPPSPTNLTVMPVNTSQIDLSWIDNTGSNSGFIVERCAGLDCSNYSNLQTINGDVPNYPDVNVCPDTFYNYQVKAFGTTWETGYAASTPVNVTAFSPAQPTLFSVTGLSETEIMLSWTDNLSEEDGYRIERCTGAGCLNFTFLTDIIDSVGTTGDTISFVNNNLSAATTYNYRVYPYKSVSCSWQNYSVSGEATTDILAPTGLIASQVDTTQVELTWTDTTTSETDFEIERCAGVGCDFSTKVVSAVGSGMVSFIDDTVTHSTDYSYRVRAVNSAVPWSSTYSNVLSVTTLTPAPPTVLSATRSSEVRIDLVWQDNSVDETNFRVERSDGTCANFVEVATVAGNLTSFSDSGLGVGSTYCYRVRAYKAATNEWYTLYSNSATATSSLLAPDSALATVVNTTELDISWSDNSETESGFEIDRCEGANCDFSSKTTFNVGPDVINYTDFSVCPGATYRYQIRAVKVGEWQSLYSSFSEVTTSVPGAPHTFSVSEVYDQQSDTRQLNLSWQDENIDETGFKVERCEGAGCSGFVEIGSYDSPVGAAEFGQFSDTSLLASTTYCYRVWSYKNSTCSWFPVAFGLYTNVICDMTRPEAPTNLTATAVNSRVITLDWLDNAKDEDGYQIEKLLRNGKFLRIDSVPAGTTTFTNTYGIDPETSYTFRVRAFRGSDISAYSNEASDTTPVFQVSDISLCPQ